MSPQTSKRTLLFAGLVLVLGVGVTLAVSFTAKTGSLLNMALREAFPAPVPGWSVREVPLGPTEFLTDASKEILGLDDYINREYAKGGVRVGVYIAYWKPGKLSARMVRGHIPDNCWVAAGWRMQPGDFLPQQIAGLDFERRVFEAGGQSQDVIYAQVVSGKVHSFSKGRSSGLLDDLMHYWDWRTAGRNEQFFIRISANVAFEQLSGSRLLDALDQFVRQHVLRPPQPPSSS